jgi:hypothetical protein
LTCLLLPIILLISWVIYSLPILSTCTLTWILKREAFCKIPHLTELFRTYAHDIFTYLQYWCPITFRYYLWIFLHFGELFSIECLLSVLCLMSYSMHFLTVVILLAGCHTHCCTTYHYSYSFSCLPFMKMKDILGELNKSKSSPVANEVTHEHGRAISQERPIRRILFKS